MTTVDSAAKYLFIWLIVLYSNKVWGQHNTATDSVEYCCEQDKIDPIYRTDHFKQELILEVYADRTYCCGSSKKARVKHKEKFVQYSSFIKLNKSMAVEFAVIRAYTEKVKFYLLNILLYAINDKRWTQVSVHHWRFLQLGKMEAAPFYGKRGTKDFCGFDGSFMIY